jgi:GNAT superfamily N-acetyltransferase
LTIREARPEDWEAIWPFFRRIVAAGETYAYDRDMSEAEGRRIWMIGPPGRTVVATDDAGGVAGTANMYANRGGPGSHVASASFMVDPDRAGHGVGRALGEHMIHWARESGFRAIARLRGPGDGSGGVRPPPPRLCRLTHHASISLMRDYVRPVARVEGPWPSVRPRPTGDKIARLSAGPY